MRQPVRAFVAIELPDRAKDALARVVGELRNARLDGLRAVRPEGIHLTLKFLGDVPADRIDAIAAAAERAAGHHTPFALALSGVGAFPNGRAPRVLWAGIAGDLDSLGALQASVDGCLGRPGLCQRAPRVQPAPHARPAARLGFTRRQVVRPRRAAYRAAPRGAELRCRRDCAVSEHARARRGSLPAIVARAARRSAPGYGVTLCAE